MANTLFVLLMDVAPEDEALFNTMYDNDHLTHIMAVPGNRRCDRFRLEWSSGPALQRYLAIYQVDDAQVPRSAEWQAQAARGNWAGEMRHRIRNRANGVFRRVGGDIPPEGDWPGAGVLLHLGGAPANGAGCTAWEKVWSSAGEMPDAMSLCSYGGLAPLRAARAGYDRVDGTAQVGAYGRIACHMHRPAG